MTSQGEGGAAEVTFYQQSCSIYICIYLFLLACCCPPRRGDIYIIPSYAARWKWDRDTYPAGPIPYPIPNQRQTPRSHLYAESSSRGPEGPARTHVGTQRASSLLLPGDGLVPSAFPQ